MYEVAPLEDGQLRPRAVGHPPRDRWVKFAVLGGNDHVARLIAPGGDGQLGAEGSAQYWHLRARHEFGRRRGQIGANVGKPRRIEEDEPVGGEFVV